MSVPPAWPQPRSTPAELLHQATLECWGHDNMDHVDQDAAATLLMRHRRTDDLPITSRTETFKLDPSSTIAAAQVRHPFHLTPSRSAW